MIFASIQEFKLYDNTQTHFLMDTTPSRQVQTRSLSAGVILPSPLHFERFIYNLQNISLFWFDICLLFPCLCCLIYFHPFSVLIGETYIWLYACVVIFTTRHSNSLITIHPYASLNISDVKGKETFILYNGDDVNKPSCNITFHPPSSSCFATFWNVGIGCR